MRKIKKYIALLLIGIFIFPVIFQSLHIIFIHNHNAINSNQQVTIYQNPKNKDKQHTLSQYQSENYCLISSYQLSTNHIPKLPFWGNLATDCDNLLNEIIINRIYKLEYSPKSSRAPPTIT
ncbi:MAG: hypothetical protein R2771_01565 [Saprospiraceae bacterium]